MSTRSYLILDLVRSKVLDLNPTESILASCFYGLLAQNPMTYNGMNYYRCDYKNISSYCSILPDKVDTLRRIYKRLENIGLITTIKIDSHIFFTPSDMLRDWGSNYESADAEKNPLNAEKNPADAEKNPLNAEKNPLSPYYNNINKYNQGIEKSEEEEKETFSLGRSLGLEPKSISVDSRVFSKVDKLLSDIVFPFDEDGFKRKFFILCCMPKWRNKTVHAIQMQLNKLKNYDVRYVLELIDASIMNEWQGLVYSDTDKKYNEWLRKSKFGGSDEIKKAVEYLEY